MKGNRVLMSVLSLGRQFAVFVMLCFVIAYSNIAYSASYTVPGTHATISLAIAASSSGDTITVSPGTYAERIDFSGKNITLISSGGTAVTTITGDGTDNPVVIFSSGETNSAVLDGFTVDNSTGAGWVSRGIYIASDSYPTIQNSILTGNLVNSVSTAGGGGIYATGVTSGTIQLINLTISNNASKYGGSALYLDNASASITGTTVFNSNSSSQGSGYAVYAKGGGSLTINASGTVSSSMSSNSGYGSSAVYFNGNGTGSVSISNITIDGNTYSTLGSGGGIYITNTGAISTIDTVVVSNNTAKDAGGGIYLTNSSQQMNINNVTVNGNSTSGGSGGGGGIAAASYSGQINITNSNIYSNTTSTGPGAGVYCNNCADMNISVTNIYSNTNSSSFSTNRGAGIAVTAAGNVDFSDGNIYKNTHTVRAGGGVYVGGAGSAFTGHECRIEGNKAVDTGGGGLYIDTSGTATLTNCFITGNVADVGTFANGGGAYNSGGFLNIYHSTIAGNYAKKWGGAVLTNNTTTVVDSSILWDNTAGSGTAHDYYAYGGTSTITYSAIKNGIYTPGAGVITSITGTVFVSSLAASTTPRNSVDDGVDYHLKTDAVEAIDSANPASGVSIDFDGTARAQGSGFEMGADEHIALSPPTATYSSATYDAASDTLVFTGANFDTIDTVGMDVKGYMDWTKLSWDINADNVTTTNISFDGSGVSSLTVTNATTLTLVFTPAKAIAIEDTAQVGLVFGADTIDITAGFSKNSGGTPATTDALVDGSLIANTQLVVTKTTDTNDANGCTLSDCSIREATIASNATASVTETIYIPTGTYAITIGGSVNDQNQTIGDFNISDDVVIDGDGEGLTIINGLANNWIFHEISGTAGISITMQDMTIGNVSVNANAACFIGNAMNLTINNVTFDSCTVTGSANKGAALYINGATTLDINNASFTNNSANGVGGAIYIDNTAAVITIDGSTFTNNQSTTNSGGAIYNKGTMTIGTSTFTNNDAAIWGGAISNVSLLLTVTDSTFKQNDAASTNTSGGGGAIYSGGNLTVQDSTFGGLSGEGNTAVEGGAIKMASGPTLLVERSTFQYNATATASANVGGAIRSYGGTISSSVFENNTAKIGGAIYSANSNVTIDNAAAGGVESRFSYNTTTGGAGGAIYHSGPSGQTVFISDTSFNNNTASGATYTGHGGAVSGQGASTTKVDLTNVTADSNIANGLGGAFFSQGNITAVGCTITNNASDRAGGGLGAYQVIDVTECDINNNQAKGLYVNGESQGAGGGIYGGKNSLITDSNVSSNIAQGSGGGAGSFAVSTAYVSVIRTTLENNASGGYGGAYWSRESSKIENSTLSGNSAVWGGALRSKNCTHIKNATIYNNTATTEGDNLWMNGVNSGCTVTNSIIWNGTGSLENCAGLTVATGGYNVTRTTGAGGEKCNFAGTNDQTTDPSLDALALNGHGLLKTHAVQNGSPADGNGDSTTCTALGNVDQRGISRPQGAPSCDTGAYEKVTGPSFEVTKTADTNDGSCDVSDCSLREAIKAANDAAGLNQINVPAGTYTITLVGTDDTNALGDFDITDDVNIVGAGSGLTIIQEGTDLASAVDRIFHVTNSSVVTLEAMKIQFGKVTTDGGCIYAVSDITINNAVIDSCASTVNLRYGGAIYSGGAVTMNNSTVSNNTANHFGGAMYTNGGTLTDVTFTNNHVLYAHGGAIYNVANLLTINGTANTFSNNYGDIASTDYGGTIYSTGSLTISNTVFTGRNDGTNDSGRGGAIYLLDTTDVLTLSDSSFSNFKATNSGAAIRMNGGTMTNVTFTNNQAVASHGGAIENFVNLLTVTGTNTFDGNRAGPAADDYGGSIYSTGSLAISNTTFLGRNDGVVDAGRGGAIYLLDTIDTLTLSGSSFSNLLATNSGGAIHMTGGTMNNVTFTHNQAQLSNGGAIENLIDSLTITGTNTFDGNRAGVNADDHGGSIYSSGSLTISNSTFTGRNDGTVDAGRGGAIYLLDIGDVLTLSDTSFSNLLTTNSGGAIHMNGGTMNNVSFTDNEAQLSTGGAIENFTNALTIAGTNTFTNNIAGVGTGDYGGMIYTTGELNLSGATASGNKADGGGAIYIAAGVALTITDSSFDANEALRLGGAIYSGSGGATISSSTFSNNFTSGGAHDGGAINSSGVLNITNSTFSANTVGDLGGAIYQTTDATIKNSTFYNNSAGGTGEAIYRGGGTVTLENTIVAKSTASSSLCVNVTSNDYNLQYNGTCFTAAANDVSGQDPLLAALAANGGTGQTHALSVGSPALDTAKLSTCTSAPVSNLDQRGAARDTGDSLCDIGAYEGSVVGGVTLSGTLFSDEGTTAVTTGVSIRLLVNGASAQTTVSDGSGNYSFSATPSSGETLTVHVNDDGTYKATTVTVSDGAALSGLNLYDQHLIVRHDNAGSLSNANLATADDGDTDILYNVSAGNITVEGASTELYIWSGDTYLPGGAVSTVHFENNGTTTLGGALTASGDFVVTSGIVDTTASNYAITVGGTFTQLAAGQVEANASTLTVAGDVVVDGTTDQTDYDAASLIMTGDGTGITFNGLTQYWQHGFNDLTAGQSGNANTLHTNMAVFNHLTIGTGSLGGGVRLYLRGTGDIMFFDVASNLSVNEILLIHNTVNIPPLVNGYDSNILAAGINQTVTQTGDITINGANSLYIKGDDFVDRVNNWDMGAFNLTVGKDIVIGVGGDTALKKLTASTGTVTVGGNFTVNDIGAGTTQAEFVSAASTVVLNGTNQAINGTVIFNNLSKSVASADTLTFEAGKTVTVNGTVTLNGASGQLLTLTSSTGSSAWSFNVASGASKSISYANVLWSDASGSHSTQKPIAPSNSTDGGDNTDWFNLPSIAATKTSVVISDPFNGTTNPKRIAGAIVEYTIETTNSGAGSPDAGTVVAIDELEAVQVEFDSNFGVVFVDGGTSSGLSVNTVSYSNSVVGGPYTYGYVLSPDVDGYDGAVSSIKVTTTGVFAISGASFKLKYRVRLQ